ncbi:MAG TPA: hypothetical protein VHJ18_30785 [Streptosporangiaceae bacterium]|jgi:hypothetical protein|nr:hypothetical protein [Streptosporangiaceae bacterium]
MITPPKVSMSDLVPLIYRSPWVRFGLSGELRSRTTESGSRVWEEREVFEVAPDGRYRSEVTDAEGDHVVEAGESEGYMRLPELLVPATRLLDDFVLQINGETEFLGRPVIAITGAHRRTCGHVPEQVSGLVDAELGIFLRYQRFSSSQTESVEFTRLTVIPPEPHDMEQDSGLLQSSSPVGSGPPTHTGPALTDDHVNLLYRSDLRPPRFAAQLSEQTDAVTLSRLGREAVAATKFGSKTQWLWDSVDDHPIQNVYMVARLALDMPDRYLIEAITDAGRKPTLIVSNGTRLWRAYPDRVAVRAAEQLPYQLTIIVDPAWLLRELYHVSVIGETVVAGRPALHLRAAFDWLPIHSGPLSGTPIMCDQVEAFIDRALGICLRLVCSYQEHLITRIELTGLTTEVDETMFDFVPPPGVKVITGGLLAEIGQTPASVALHIAKGTAGLAFEIGRRWINRK